jgi:hypothetical protein
LAKAPKAPEPPPPPDPIAERAQRRWDEFESQSDEGRIAVFLETLEDAEVMEDELAVEMLRRLHSDAVERGDRVRLSELVAALRERLPGVYDKSASYYLSWCARDALAENRLEAVAWLTRDLAARAGRDVDMFNRIAEALAYHGQLSILVEAFRIAWPGVKSSKNIVPWGVSGFMNTGADYEIFDYLEHTRSPDPTDRVLLDRVKFFVEDPREDYTRRSRSSCRVTRTIRRWNAKNRLGQQTHRRAQQDPAVTSFYDEHDQISDQATWPPSHRNVAGSARKSARQPPVPAPRRSESSSRRASSARRDWKSPRLYSSRTRRNACWAR